MTGFTSDTALVQNAGANFLAYMGVNMQQWNYMKELPYQSEDLVSFSFRYDGLRAVLLYSSNLIVLLNISATSVSVYKAYKET